MAWILRHWIIRILLSFALPLATISALAGCEIAPADATCQVAMSPVDLGIIVHDGRVSGMLTIACDEPPSSLHDSITLSRERNGVFNPVNGEDFDKASTDGNYVVTAPCIPGRWRFSYSVVITANGETKYPSAVSDATEVQPDDC